MLKKVVSATSGSAGQRQRHFPKTSTTLADWNTNVEMRQFQPHRPGHGPKGWQNYGQREAEALSPKSPWRRAASPGLDFTRLSRLQERQTKLHFCLSLYFGVTLL